MYYPRNDHAFDKSKQVIFLFTCLKNIGMFQIQINESYVFPNIFQCNALVTWKKDLMY